VAVTQIRLAREQVNFLSRLSSATRLTFHGRYLLRIDILRLLVEELFRARLEPERITSVQALETLLASHFRTARGQAERPVARLACCLESDPASAAPRRSGLDFGRPGKPGVSPAAAFESFTLRRSTADIVAIDTFRCDVRERRGFILSRSGLLRALLDSFVEAVRVADLVPSAGARPEGRTASSTR
jgi:hypothetical protein